MGDLWSSVSISKKNVFGKWWIVQILRQQVKVKTLQWNEGLKQLGKLSWKDSTTPQLWSFAIRDAHISWVCCLVSLQLWEFAGCSEIKADKVCQSDTPTEGVTEGVTDSLSIWTRLSGLCLEWRCVLNPERVQNLWRHPFWSHTKWNLLPGKKGMCKFEMVESRLANKVFMHHNLSWGALSWGSWLWEFHEKAPHQYYRWWFAQMCTGCLRPGHRRCQTHNVSWTVHQRLTGKT